MGGLIDGLLSFFVVFIALVAYQQWDQLWYFLRSAAYAYKHLGGLAFSVLWHGLGGGGG